MPWLQHFNSSARYFVLVFSKTIDTVFQTTKWRLLAPSILNEIPHVPLPIYPDMTFYSEVPGGIIEFLKTPNTTLSCLTSVLNITVTLPVLVFLLFKINAIFEPIMREVGSRLALNTHGEEWVNENSEKIFKFGEYCYRLTYHTFVTFYAIIVFREMPWVWDTKEMWTNYFSYPVTVGLTWYTLIQCAYNIQQLLTVFARSFLLKRKYPFIEWSPNCRGDFREMSLHHVVTNALVLSSSYFRITRSGTMVMICHDISDIPVDMSKLANFLKWKKTTNACFVTMLLFWIFLRLYYFPFHIIWSVQYESVVMRDDISPGMSEDSFLLYNRSFVIGLSMLAVLHWVWFSMLVRIGLLILLKGEHHDLSEHKKGEKLE